MASEVVVLLHDAHGLIDVFLVSFNGQASVLQTSAYVQSVFEKANVLVQCAEEGFNFSRNVNRALHALGRFSSSRQVADGILPEISGWRPQQRSSR